MTNVLDFIDLGRAEETTLVERVMRPNATEPFGLYAFNASEPGAELGRRVERAVFFDAFGDTADELADEYDPYEPASYFFVVIDHRRRIAAGAMRVIMPTDAGQKSLDDLLRVWGRSADGVISGTATFPTGTAWDLATLAVHPQYRGAATSGLVSLSLIQALNMTAPPSGVSAYVTVLDSVVLRFLQWQLNKPFQAFAGIDARPYLGSPLSQAVFCDVTEWRDRLAIANPALHELLFEGTGQEAAVAPLDWAVVASEMHAARVG
jgi:hypothetical protein